jgi:hypothetical protein
MWDETPQGEENNEKGQTEEKVERGRISQGR